MRARVGKRLAVGIDRLDERADFLHGEVEGLMHSIGAAVLFVMISLFAMVPRAAQATLFRGTWVPDSAATAEYCRDGACARHPVDAWIFLPPPRTTDAIVLSTWRIGFLPVAPDVEVAFAMNFSEALLAAGTLPFRPDYPNFLDVDLAIHIDTDRSFTLNGSFHHVTSEGIFDVRFRDVVFVPVPEPGSAGLIGLGLAALAARGRRSSEGR